MTLTYPTSPSMNENIADSISRIRDNFDYLDGNLTSRTAKLHTTTRDLSAASGDVSYTVTGLTPKCVIVFAVEPTNNMLSFGFIDEDGLDCCMYLDAEGGWEADTSNCITLYEQHGDSKIQTAVWKSYAADTFTLTWTKTGAPTGTANLLFLVLS